MAKTPIYQEPDINKLSKGADAQTSYTGPPQEKQPINPKYTGG